MLIYFLRHADAVPDGQRPLSDAGCKQMKKVAAFIQQSGIQVDGLLTSPLLRASQTAEMVSGVLGLEPCINERLNSGAGLSGLRELLRNCRSDSAVMLVGHEPDFSEIIGELIGGGQVEVKKAALALVECGEVTEGAGILKWLVPVKLMG